MCCGKSVMVVDDDEDIREVLVESLAENGYETMSAGNGAEALSALQHGQLPCVILLDIMMPVMDGWAFRAVQQKNPAFSAIPVVVVTAVGDADEQARAMGAAAALHKPFDLDPLLQTVARVCH